MKVNLKEPGSKWLFGMLLLLVILVVSMLYPFLFESKVLLSTDAAIAHANKSAGQVLSELAVRWQPQKLIGLAAMPSISVPHALKTIFPPVFWNNIVYVLGCALSALVLAGWLYRRGMGGIVAALSGIIAFFIGSNLTLLYAGHVLKPYVLLFFVLSLLPASAAAGGSLASALIWGSCVGLMFTQQPDIAFFCAMFSGAYLVFSLCRQQGFKPLEWLKVLIAAAVMAFLFASGPLLSGYQHHVKSTSQMQTKNAEQKWDYVTQWSVPPTEVVDFVAPGYFGWRSGDQAGPYWGRTGRSPEWETTKQGFRNFRLESTYIGIIPVAFAFFALFACRRSKHKAEILFWTGAAAVSLLLAFGKYFPLYALFYKLPVVSNIRNPNKFIQIFQICIAIMAAYGFDTLWRSKESGGTEDEQNKPVRGFFWTSLGVLVVMGLGALIAMLGQEGGIDRFVAEGWPKEGAQMIVQNKATALWHAFFMIIVVTSVFAVFSFKRCSAVVRYRNSIAALLVLIVSIDAIRLSKHYIQDMPRSYIEANALTDFLQANLEEERVALVSQQGIYGIWLTYLLPYNHIPSFNVDQIGRMPQDYEKLLSAGSRNPLRMWRFSGVKYVLAPSAIEKQVPPGQLRKVFAYDLSKASGNEFRVVATPAGSHAVFELLQRIPRFSLVKSVSPESDDQILARLASPADPLPGANQVPGSIEIQKFRPGRVELYVQIEKPCMVRAAERWDPDWKATVDGSPVDVQRIDFICQGVPVPAGSHEVVLVYAPSRIFFYVQCSGYLILLIALITKKLTAHEED